MARLDGCYGPEYRSVSQQLVMNIRFLLKYYIIILLSLDDILHAARRLLKAKGRLAMIYPASRLVDMMVRMRSFGLEPKKVRVLYPGETSESKLVLIEASLGGRSGLKIMPPLFDQGCFSINRHRI